MKIAPCLLWKALPWLLPKTTYCLRSIHVVRSKTTPHCRSSELGQEIWSDPGIERDQFFHWQRRNRWISRAERSGKSTTLRILSGLIPADSGEAKVCGVDLAEEEGEVRRHVGYLAENNPLPEDLRVVEYLDFRAKLKGLGGSRKRERIRIVLDICDLERKVSERKIGNLSKGFRQRVGIADSLLAEPRLVILDEPTIGLDPRQSAITRKMMERLRGEVSFLLSSHILSEVEACCDRMIILSHGQIVAEGTLLDLQKEFINSTVFEIVAFGNRIELQRMIRTIDETCELIQDDPVEVTGRRRFTFTTGKGSEVAEIIL